MRTNNFTTILLGVLLACSCLKIDLDKTEITTFAQALFSYKQLGNHRFMPFYIDKDGRYWIGGIDEINLSLISIYASDGSIENQFTGPSPGEVVAIEPLNSNGDRFLIASTTNDETYISEINDIGQVIKIDSLRPKVNAILGLVVQVYCTKLIPAKNGGWIITGQIKQSIGGARFFLAKLSFEGEIEWVRTYQLGLTGFGIEITETGKIVVLSFNTNGTPSIGFFDETGVLEWSTTVTDAFSAPHSNLLVSGDSIITVASKNVFNSTDAFIIGYNYSGDRIVSKTLGLPAIAELGGAVALTRRHGLLVFSTDDHNRIYELTKLDRNSFSPKWTRKYEAENDDAAFLKAVRCMQLVPGYGMLALGFESDTTQNNHNKYKLIKTDEIGAIRQ